MTPKARAITVGVIIFISCLGLSFVTNAYRYIIIKRHNPNITFWEFYWGYAR